MAAKHGMATAIEQVPVIHPRAVYSRVQATAALGLAPSTLATEIKLGRLRVARRAGRYLILGKWLLEWIEAGELSSRQKQGAVEGSIRPSRVQEARMP
jgi:hypothetical protein